MKKIMVFVCIALICIVGYVGITATNNQQVKTEYLRIHIRANSNSEIDQTVKYKIKEILVDYLTPYLAEAKTKENAQKILSNKLKDIQKVCDKELKNQGFTYSSNAKLRNEKFPTRVYDNLTLESGYYDALIVELGSGTGDNWWCVVYPPLCFTTSNAKYEYKSKIKEIIEKFFVEKENKWKKDYV